VLALFPNPVEDGMVFVRLLPGLKIENWRLISMQGSLLASGEVESIGSSIRNFSNVDAQLPENSNFNSTNELFSIMLFPLQYSGWCVLEIRLSNGQSSFHKIAF
jgi:hypothetical protein